jgi:hypothetical protein
MAPLYLGSTAISKVYKGSTELAQNYLGDNAMLSTITPTEHFGIVTYTGNGGSQSITGLGFQPDFVWQKRRDDGGDHNVTDSSRGTQKGLNPNTTAAEGNQAPFGVTSFDSDGFSVADNSGGGAGVNGSSQTYVGWGWKANGGNTSSNTNGTITSTVQANTTAGFSIVTYTGNNGSSATIGHGLDSAPQLIFVKVRNSTNGWPTLFNDGSYSNYGIRLSHTTVDLNNQTVFFNNTAPTDTVFSVGSSDETNDGFNYVAYCFHSVAGYQKVGHYTGTGSTGLEVSLGFQARFIMVKKVAPSGDRWLMADTARHAALNNDAFLDTTSTLSERDFNCTNGITFGSTSFTVNTTDGSFNSSGGTYIYLAIA